MTFKANLRNKQERQSAFPWFHQTDMNVISNISYWTQYELFHAWPCIEVRRNGYLREEQMNFWPQTKDIHGVFELQAGWAPKLSKI